MGGALIVLDRSRPSEWIAAGTPVTPRTGYDLLVRAAAALRRPATRLAGTVMRICMLTYEFPRSLAEPIPSGEVKNPFHLVRGLLAAGHDVTVVSVPYVTRSVRREGPRTGLRPPTYDVPEGRLRGAARTMLRVRNVERCLASLDGRRFDVVHAQAPALATAALRARGRAPALRGVPVVTTPHGLSLPEARADAARQSLGPSLRRRLRALNARLTLPLERDALRRSAAVVATSGADEGRLREAYGVARERLVPIPNGVDRGLYCPEPAPDAAGSREPVVLFVGRLVPKKGLQHLVAAFPAIAAAVPDARCVVVGATAAFDTHGGALHRLADRAGVTGRFTWLAGVPESELPGLYRSAAVCAVPSVGYESLPTVVLEAMACGTPVVATNGWGIPEALGSDHPGLVPEADPTALAAAVVRMLTDPDAAGAARREQATRIERFDLNAIVAAHEELYERVRAR